MPRSGFLEPWHAPKPRSLGELLIENLFPRLGDARRSVKIMRRLLRYRIRTLLLAVLACAGLMAIYLHAKRIHHAARFIEAHGGDVWLGDTLYSGAGFGGVKPRTNTQQRLTQIRVIVSVLVGQETELWVTSIPEQRDEFLENIDLLNATSINFGVLGETDRTWINNRLPSLAVSADCGSDSTTDLETLPLKNPLVESRSTPVAQDEFVNSMLAIEAILEANPQLNYRLDRYETLIGYPIQGKMGRLLDKRTGEIILLPWPK